MLTVKIESSIVRLSNKRKETSQMKATQENKLNPVRQLETSGVIRDCATKQILGFYDRFKGTVGVNGYKENFPAMDEEHALDILSEKLKA